MSARLLPLAPCFSKSWRRRQSDPGPAQASFALSPEHRPFDGEPERLKDESSASDIQPRGSNKWTTLPRKRKRAYSFRNDYSEQLRTLGTLSTYMFPGSQRHKELPAEATMDRNSIVDRHASASNSTESLKQIDNSPGESDVDYQSLPSPPEPFCFVIDHDFGRKVCLEYMISEQVDKWRVYKYGQEIAEQYRRRMTPSPVRRAYEERIELNMKRFSETMSDTDEEIGPDAGAEQHADSPAAPLTDPTTPSETEISEREGLQDGVEEYTTFMLDEKGTKRKRVGESRSPQRTCRMEDEGRREVRNGFGLGQGVHDEIESERGRKRRRTDRSSHYVHHLW